MFQVSRNPNWGFHINMFSKVAVNVLKVSSHNKLSNDENSGYRKKTGLIFQ